MGHHGKSLRSLPPTARSCLDAGKNGLTRDTQRDATADEVRRLKDENETLKRALAESILDVQRYKKSLGM